MKLSPEKIEQAKKLLDNCRQDGKLTISIESFNELKFIATGSKNEYSPKEGSNCSFFHLNSISCNLFINGGMPIKGTFSHPDYERYYEFKNDEFQTYFEGGNEFEGILIYENYEPVCLNLLVKYSGLSKELIRANRSLTDSCL